MKVKVGFQGVEELIVNRLPLIISGEDTNLKAYDSFALVFEALRKRQIDYAANSP